MSECLFNKDAGLRACNFIKKRLQQKCFPVKFKKFLRTPILKNICKRLFLLHADIILTVGYNAIDFDRTRILVIKTN